MATLVKRTGNAPPIPNEAQQSFVQYASEVMRVANNNYNMRERMQQIDRLYQRETDYTTAHARARRANMTGDSSKMQHRLASCDAASRVAAFRAFKYLPSFLSVVSCVQQA